MPSLILEVALPVPLRQTFDYLAPENYSHEQLVTGARVKVPFANRELVGVIIQSKNHSEYELNKLKAVIEVIETQACIPSKLLALCRWSANYYHYPLGEVIFAALPKRLREGLPEQKPSYWVHTTEGLGLPVDALKRAKKQQALHQALLNYKQLPEDELKRLEIPLAAAKALEEKGLIKKEMGFREPAETTQILNTPGLDLSEQQEAALTELRYHEFNAYLLEGITGSGKTEVYLQAIARVLQTGRQALVLIPEIGLTPQTVSRFRNRFNVSTVELHSNVSEGEREKNWSAARDGRAKIVIGTRLASLCPMHDLGIIVVDEEHDTSYKQQDNFRYSARDISIYRAKTLNIPVILGTATPSLETLNNAIQGRYQHLRLTKRAGAATAPSLQLVDLKNKALTAGLSPEAIEQIGKTLAAGNQVMVFVNRRGFAPALLCHQCGWTANCQSCDSKMTLHTNPRHLHCHYCDRQRPVPRACPQCGTTDLQYRGLGTEQTEQALEQIFKGTPVIRIDRDSTSQKGAFQSALNELHKGEPCIAVGTQMLAKGHHLPKITLVIIVDADQGLMSADFRGTEKLGQLIIQVAGRAGREEQKGRVLIQSHSPEHPLLETLLTKGYHRFARQLLSDRKVTRMPPFTQLAILRAESKRVENTIELLELARSLAELVEPVSMNVRYLGPIPSPVEKVQDRFRYQLQILSGDRKKMNGLLEKLTTELPGYAIAKRTRWSLDVDGVE